MSEITQGLVTSAPVSGGFHLMAKPSGPACNLDCS